MNPIARSISLARSFATVATRFLPENRLVSVRVRLLRLAGATIERRARVIGYQAMTSPEDVFIGEDAYVNTGCLFVGGARIDIKAHAMIGPRTSLVTINHTGETLRGSAISADHRGAVRMDWNRRDDLPWRYDRSPCRSRGGLSRHARRCATCARRRKPSTTVTVAYAASGSPGRSIDVRPALSVVSSTTYPLASSALSARDRDRAVAELIRPRRGRVGLRECAPIIGRVAGEHHCPD